MGNLFSQPSKEESPQHKKGETEEGTKRVRLLVLHAPSQQFKREINEFCDALRMHPPPGDIEVSNKKFSQVPLSVHEINECRQWILDWLKRGRVVVICLLTNCDLQQLNGDGLNVNNQKIIVTKFKSPHVHNPPGINRIIVIDVNLEIATKNEIKNKLDELADLIRGGGH